jgi:hypothetical protein
MEIVGVGIAAGQLALSQTSSNPIPADAAM